jgi:hypothetical protein
MLATRPATQNTRPDQSLAMMRPFLERRQDPDQASRDMLLHRFAAAARRHALRTAHAAHTRLLRERSQKYSLAGTLKRTAFQVSEGRRTTTPTGGSAVLRVRVSVISVNAG